MKRSTFLKRLAIGLLGAPAVLQAMEPPKVWRPVRVGSETYDDPELWSCISDYDGKVAFIVDYVNAFSVTRPRNGPLTGITAV